MESHRHTAVQNKSLVINNIPKDLLVDTDKDLLSFVISSVLSTVVYYTRSSCIVISVKVYHDIILLHIRDNSIMNNEEVIKTLNKLQSIAGQLGGSITINIAASKNTSLTFSFVSGAETVFHQNIKN